MNGLAELEQAFRTIADRSVERIRINGEFSFGANNKRQRRKLIDFVAGCTNVRSLKLRNLDTLDDSDLLPLRDLTGTCCILIFVWKCFLRFGLNSGYRFGFGFGRPGPLFLSLLIKCELNSLAI